MTEFLNAVTADRESLEDLGIVRSQSAGDLVKASFETPVANDRDV